MRVAAFTQNIYADDRSVTHVTMMDDDLDRSCRFTVDVGDEYDAWVALGCPVAMVTVIDRRRPTMPDTYRDEEALAFLHWSRPAANPNANSIPVGGVGYRYKNGAMVIARLQHYVLCYWRKANCMSRLEYVIWTAVTRDGIDTGDVECGEYFQTFEAATDYWKKHILLH